MNGCQETLFSGFKGVVLDIGALWIGMRFSGADQSVSRLRRWCSAEGIGAAASVVCAWPVRREGDDLRQESCGVAQRYSAVIGSHRGRRAWRRPSPTKLDPFAVPYTVSCNNGCSASVAPVGDSVQHTLGLLPRYSCLCERFTAFNCRKQDQPIQQSFPSEADSQVDHTLQSR